MSWEVEPIIGRPSPLHPYREPIYRPLTETEKKQCRAALAYRGYTRGQLAKAFHVPLRDIHEALGEECLRCTDRDEASAKLDAQFKVVRQYSQLGLFVALVVSAIHALWRAI